jgi:hypothetical protein
LDEIAAICRRIGFEIDRYDELIRVIGYRRNGII